jgi:acetyltransferase-like isoleucine patch superfamily enzyme
MPLDPIVSSNIRLRHPEYFKIGQGSIIDDYCYISTRLEVGNLTHIASGCSIAGGVDRLCRVGNFSSLSSGVKVWCASDDFARDIVTIIPPGFPDVKEHLITGDVIFDDMVAVGANSVIMPDNHIPEGVAIGALSFVPPLRR